MAVTEGKVLFNRNIIPEMFELDMVLKNQFVFLIRLAPKKRTETAPSQESGYLELHENICILIFPFILLLILLSF